MLHNSDYKFHKLSSLKSDNCDISQRTIQNSNYATYMLENYKPQCPMNSAMELATSQPCVNFTGSKQVGIGGCNIDDNSKLHLTNLSRERSKLNLNQRLFATVPYVGKGPHNPVLESRVQQGEFSNNRKSLGSTTELSHIKYRNTPMIDTLKNTISNPANLVEDVASKGWIRGGIPSREFSKDNNENYRK